MRAADPVQMPVPPKQPSMSAGYGLPWRCLRLCAPPACPRLIARAPCWHCLTTVAAAPLCAPQVVAVEPTESPVISGGSPGPHKIQARCDTSELLLRRPLAAWTSAQAGDLATCPCAAPRRTPAAVPLPQGIGAGFVPKNLDTSLLDGVVKVRHVRGCAPRSSTAASTPK